MREAMRRTVSAALRYNTSTVPASSGFCDFPANDKQVGKVRGVTPWLALGGGGGASYGPSIDCDDMRGGRSQPPGACPDPRLVDPFGFWHNDYDRALSWQLGSELYARRPPDSCACVPSLTPLAVPDQESPQPL